MNKIAQTPPMGWNSWDCYGSAVTEKEVRSNAEYMARHMAKHGWEYVVVDILWFDPDAEDSQYTPYGDICIDEYGRVIPAENRFPSAAGGKGFGPLADYVHSLGLKFGIHILRGVPRKAVYARCPVKGTDLTCRDIAHRNDNCPWNTDMYGVDCMRRGAQEYYDSIFELYAAWGVDYVKVDDIASPYHGGEIELVHNAIEHCGRDIVLSLSCGPAPRDKAEHLCRFANLWRTTGDFWDDWNDLYHAFEICHEWEGVGGPGHWPDADMLPFGHLAIRATERGWGERWTHFTQDEQITLMTLWCIFRSPLMVGAELNDNDEFTLNLLTNDEVLALLRDGRNARQVYREERYNYAGEVIVWKAEDEAGAAYCAVFNCGPKARDLAVQLQSTLDLPEGKYAGRDLWAHEEVPVGAHALEVVVPSHGARLIKLTRAE